MENKVKTLLENRGLAQEREKAGQTVYSCEEILGSMEPVKDFAAFYMRHKIDLDLVEASLLLDFCRGEFTKEEKLAYERGLSHFLRFFEMSDNEMDLYVRAAEKENEK